MAFNVLPRNGRRIVQFRFAEEKTDLQKVYETRNGCQECHVRFATGQNKTGQTGQDKTGQTGQDKIGQVLIRR